MFHSIMRCTIAATNVLHLSLLSLFAEISAIEEMDWFEGASVFGCNWHGNTATVRKLLPLLGLERTTIFVKALNDIYLSDPTPAGLTRALAAVDDIAKTVDLPSDMVLEFKDNIQGTL